MEKHEASIIGQLIDKMESEYKKQMEAFSTSPYSGYDKILTSLKREIIEILRNFKSE